jgi:4-alpha-glucanotransferase
MNDSTSMLLCAEDLGMIPKACPDTLKEFGIPGNDVQRWVKDWSVKHDFLDPEEYRLLSVAMLSTHDTTNWAAWWENEAGTVDEALFIRKCKERGIEYALVRPKLFDPARSRHGRLRWLEGVSSVNMLAGVLGKPKEEIKDFTELYENTYFEKEKLWRKLGMKDKIEESASPGLAITALGITSSSRSIFCIELICDYLYACGVFDGDPYDYRVNCPGTVGDKNWSLRMPVSLEELLKGNMPGTIKKIVKDTGR